MPNDPTTDPQQVVTNDQTNTTNTPPVTPSLNGAPTVPGANAAPGAPAQQPVQTQQSAQQPSGQQQPQPVSNAPVPVHPSVQRAGVIRQIATALAGGPRFTTSIDPNTGTTTRTQVPLTKSDLGMAIALEAISGGLAGLAQRGPGATGRAAAAGFQQVSQQQQQAAQAQEQQAQTDNATQAAALARRASIFETNSRSLLNVAEAEQQGADAIDKLVSINRASGVLDIDPSLTDNGGQPMTQDELMDAMKSGKLSPTDQLGPVAGRVEVTNPDGTKRWEATHLVVKNPNTPIDLSQEQWDSFADAGVPGFPKGTKIGAGVQIPLRMMQSANEVVAAHYLANQRLSDLRDVLDGTPAAKNVPTSIDFFRPGVETAIQRFQKYVSHNATNLEDPYTALQEMGADKRDPKTGEMQPNPDAKYVSTVADALGGWSTLSAAHDQIAANKKTASDFAVIDTADKANAVLAAPKRFTVDQVSAARNFLALSNQQGARKATEEARARAVAEGTDVQAMFRFGRNPVTGEQLSLSNAPDAMLVDSQGRVIPQDLTSTYRPSAQEKQTADTARQVLTISQRLRAAVQANQNLIGPLVGRSKEGLAKAGLGDAEAQQFLDDVSFLQTAATKMHTGRFSVPIIDKMNNIIKPGMNVDQFNGALNSINNVATLYSNEDRLVTVGDLKAMQDSAQRISNTGSSRVPPVTSLRNIQVNRKTQQRIGWNGSAWVDATTGQPVR